MATVLASCLCLTLLGCDRPQPASIAPHALTAPRTADFGSESAGIEVHRLADWIVGSGDHAGKAFALIDKRLAKVYVFTADGRLAGASPVLLGSTIGDDTVPGIGSKRIADVLPSERTTPAGRFVTVPGHNADGKPVIWVDYDAAVSMHEVVTHVASERRLERLAASDPAEHRVSYGCINVPPEFFKAQLLPAMADRGAVVYILPETRPLAASFPALAS